MWWGGTSRSPKNVRLREASSPSPPKSKNWVRKKGPLVTTVQAKGHGKGQRGSLPLFQRTETQLVLGLLRVAGLSLAPLRQGEVDGGFGRPSFQSTPFLPPLRACFRPILP